ncbi:hypothetical protein PoB_006593500 [Plakobranchus ocellatus]|uniref:Uncharacterized protein n=1 Tax=Plakobranchus ocellatus TaxID=259542 RepID=A0AAV4D5K3_9GAST|nr:hypothetical protein PoB_006593500 [Plakobranchus ocellatus]
MAPSPDLVVLQRPLSWVQWKEAGGETDRRKTDNMQLWTKRPFAQIRPFHTIGTNLANRCTARLGCAYETPMGLKSARQSKAKIKAYGLS